jgi:hypothetical protein
MYDLPASTIVNRVIPKKVFIDQLGANTRMKDHFTNDIVKVEWLAKLAPSTLNVADGKEVHEISVFQVPLKEDECSNDLFAFIDTMIPRHTLFILCKEEQACLHLNYKEHIDSVGRTEKAFHITKTYRSAWINNSSLTIQIEGLNMDAIYETLVRQVAGKRIISASNDLKSDVEVSAEHEVLIQQLETLKKKEASEIQPQKKFALHQQILELNKRLS